MERIEEVKPSRAQIAVRLVFTVLYLIIFEVLKLVIQITALFQFVCLLVTQSYSTPLRVFSNKVAAYAYRLIRYVTLNENARPFPFSDFPKEMERAEEPPSFQ